MIRGRFLIGIIAYLCFLVAVQIACSRTAENQEGGNLVMASPTEVREPAVAGGFYPGNENVLRRTVEDLIAKADVQSVPGKVIGLISPHAGYMYSGAIAAHAYKIIKGLDFESVVIVAPSHYAHFQGCSVYPSGAYKTPLGLAIIDSIITKRLMESDKIISFYPKAHLREHSIEVQIPFIQVVLPKAKIVPILMGDQSVETCRRLANAIANAVKGKNVVLIASSDLSHFYDYDRAVQMDRVVIDDVQRFDYEELGRDLEKRTAEACGGGAMITVMMASKQLGADQSMILKYANSGDVTGDHSSVVGYLSSVFFSKGSRKQEPERSEQVGIDLGIGEKEKLELLKIARQSIEANVNGLPVPEFQVESEILKKQMGAFVTLTKKGELRGCIGNIVGTGPLFLTVSKMAIAAASEDPRFPPVRKHELDDIVVEISVLTPLKEIRGPEDIVIGRDGLYIEKGMNHGLLLPQVATEYGWGREEFLDHTCIKAGLKPGSWQQGARIYSFSAQIFNETGLGLRP